MPVVRKLVGLASLLLLSGCERDAARSNGAPVPAAEPVVVYAAQADVAYLASLFADFTKQTGAVVIVRTGEQSTIVDDIIANDISPPADVLWVPELSAAMRAADESALRPFRNFSPQDHVQKGFWDADNYWVTVSYDVAAIVYDPQKVDVRQIDDFAALAKPVFGGLLCLSSSANSINTAAIETMVAIQQVRPAEIAVRGWVANLAQPVYTTESDLIGAIESGDCGLAIVSSSVVARAAASASPFKVLVPPITPIDAEAIGVARHARNPQGGEALVQWLLSSTVQERHIATTFALPANWNAKPRAEVLEVIKTRTGSTEGFHVVVDRYEASRLAERARYR